jgi:hypothetical protein
MHQFKSNLITIFIEEGEISFHAPELLACPLPFQFYPLRKLDSTNFIWYFIKNIFTEGEGMV